MKYRVQVPDFWFGARTHQPGDVLEADDTVEVLTNVALGRIKPIAAVVEQPTAPQPTPRPAPSLQEPPRLLDAEPAPRRKYMRRDMRGED